MCEIRDEMQGVYKELTRDEIRSKVAKSAFNSKKTSRRRRMTLDGVV